MNTNGDNFTNLTWDGPEDSDEEIEEMITYKNEFEIKEGIKFSKNGIIKYIEDKINLESATN